MSGLVVERTGKFFLPHETEFKISFPDGTSTLIWSPSFEMSDAEKDKEALEYALELWKFFQSHPEFDRTMGTRYEGGELIIPDVVE